MERAHSAALPSSSQQPQSVASALLAGVAIAYLVLLYFRQSPQKLAWDAFVSLLPQRLLLCAARRQELQSAGMLAIHAHEAKKDALRGLFGLGGAAMLAKLPSSAGEGIGKVRSAFSSTPQHLDSDLPAGLGNWDNSCYQNCVLQALSSLDALSPFLRRVEGTATGQEETTSGNLVNLVAGLNDETNNGRRLWAPAKLKNMSSWQQQDAQEYYSKIMEEIEKDGVRAFAAGSGATKPGLESLVRQEDAVVESEREEAAATTMKNPLDGLLAQKVTCTRCDFSEGLSLIPFNCLTLPLPETATTDLNSCLDAYTAVEDIPEVECAKCTLQRAQQQLEQMLPTCPSTTHGSDTVPAVNSKTLQLPPELRAQAFKRLAAIQQALEKDDFADKTLTEICQLGKKARVSSTKTKAVQLARAPACLALHVNRSVFDERTGVQRKNYARLEYPLVLDAGRWMLQASASAAAEGESEKAPQEDRLVYHLKAVVTHYGRHENGHYICYRRHRLRQKLEVEDDVDPDEDDSYLQHAETAGGDPWYRLSDEDVTPVSEENVLAQGGVFMLFYERDATASERSPAPFDPVPSMKEAPLTVESAAIDTANIVQQNEVPHKHPSAAHDSVLIPAEEADHQPSATPSSTRSLSPSTSSLDLPSTEATTEDECEEDPIDFEGRAGNTSPILMRTSHFVSDSDENGESGLKRGWRVGVAT